MTFPLDIGDIPAGQLRLAPLGPTDAEALRAVTSDPAVTSVIPFLPEPFGLEQAQALLDRQKQGQDLYLGIRTNASDVVPGVPEGTLLGPGVPEGTLLGSGVPEGTLLGSGVPEGTLLGVVGVHLLGACELEIGYWLPGRHHGLGIAGTAVPAVAAAYARAFPDRRLIAECHPDNAASRRVLARAGFRPTGQAGERPGRERYRYAPER